MRITFKEYRNLLMDSETSEEEMLKYSKIEKGEGGFDWKLVANEKLVEITDEDRELENALSIGNGVARWKRRMEFKRRKDNENLPVIVSEGDSWFQFPFLIRDTIDHLKSDYLIWSIGAAGDTAQNMLINKKEYLNALRKFRQEVRAFLLSAAGNDIIGEDPNSGIAALQNILKNFNGNVNDIDGHINFPVLGERLSFLGKTYQNTINTIRNEPGLRELPIIIHGYDYVFPYPWHKDPRSPSYAKNNEWLGEPLDNRGVLDKGLRRKLLIRLIDELYEMLSHLANNNKNVWLVDCRNTLTDVNDWNDEIHGTSAGFAKIAKKFKVVIDRAISGH